MAPGGLKGFGTLNRYSNMLTFTVQLGKPKSPLFDNVLITKSNVRVLLSNDLITKAKEPAESRDMMES